MIRVTGTKAAINEGVYWIESENGKIAFDFLIHSTLPRYQSTLHPDDIVAFQDFIAEGAKRTFGYYQQSKAENTIYKYKTIIGKKLRARREVETINWM